MEHELHCPWVFWQEGSYEGPRPSTETTADEWVSRLAKIVEFATVEAFWRFFQNFAQEGDPGVSYNVFRKSIKPLWEDAANANGGGRWYFSLARPSVTTTTSKATEFRDKVHETWMYLILSVIGNAIDPADIVCGVILSFRRREMRYMVWTKKSNDTTLLALGRAIKKNLRHCPRMTYRKHADRRRTGAALYC